MQYLHNRTLTHSPSEAVLHCTYQFRSNKCMLRVSAAYCIDKPCCRRTSCKHVHLQHLSLCSLCKSVPLLLLCRTPSALVFLPSGCSLAPLRYFSVVSLIYCHLSYLQAAQSLQESLIVSRPASADLQCRVLYTADEG